MLQWVSSTRAAAKAITPEVIGRPPSDGPAEPHGGAAGRAGELAINDHQFLVIERDGAGGVNAAVKKIYKIDITGATDIRNVPALPQTGIPGGIVAVTKGVDPFIDLLDFTDPAHPPFIPLATFPEKIEGLAFGPDLPDGRHVLVVTNDNDFMPNQSNRFFVFAIDPVDLLGFTPQDIAPSHRCPDDEDDDEQ